MLGGLVASIVYEDRVISLKLPPVPTAPPSM